jgi:two-component system CheB/CheR fusion protein
MRPLRILVVDDHADTCAFLVRLLAGDGHAVRTAGTIADALAAAAATDGDGDGPPGYDVVLADVGLPDGLGTDLMAELRRRYDVAGVALTGYGDEDTRADCAAAGFAAVLVKPVSYEQLRAAVEAAARCRCGEG